MAVTNLETLVQFGVTVVGNVGTERERIGSNSAADQARASLSFVLDPVPCYPPADPCPRQCHERMAKADGRTGRSASWQGTFLRTRRGSAATGAAAWGIASPSAAAAAVRGKRAG